MATITASAAGGNSSATTCWVGGVVPTSADDVVLAATSGSVTLDANLNCRSLDCQAVGNYAGTLDFGVFSLSIGDATAGAGSVALRLSTTMTLNMSNGLAALNFVSSSATQQTITPGGRNIRGGNFTGSGSWKLLGSWGASGSTVMTLTAGSLDTNGQTMSIAGMAISGAGAKSLTLGASLISITQAAGWVYNGSNLTFSAGTSTITLAVNGAVFSGGGLTYNNVTYVPASAGTVAVFSGTNTFNTLTITGINSTGMLVSFAANQTMTNLSVISTANGANRILLQSDTPGTARTLTVANAPTLTSVDFSDITAAGPAIPWTGTALGDALGNTNITFPASRTLYMISPATLWNTATAWSLTSGGASANTSPLPQDDIVLDANTGSGTANCNFRRLGRNLNASAFTGTLSMTATGSAFYGDVTLGASVTMAQTAVLTLSGRGAQKLTSNGKAFTAGVSIVSVLPGAYTLQDNVSMAGALTLTSGGLDANGKNVTATSFNGGATAPRTLAMSSGTWTLTGTGTVLSIPSTGITFTTSTANTILSDTTAATKTLAITSAITNFGDLTIPASGAGNTVQTTGGVKFRNVTVGAGSTLLLAINSTMGGTLTATGATIGSTVPGTARTFTVGTASTCPGLTVRDTKFSGPTLRAPGGVNNGNNAGIDFRKVGPLLAAA